MLLGVFSLRLTLDISVYVLVFYACSVTVFAFVLRKRHKQLSHLFIYPLFSAMQVSSSAIFVAKNHFLFNCPQIISDSLITVFIAVETGCIAVFFLKVSILPKSLTVTFWGLSILFCAYLVFKAYSKNFGIQIIESSYVYQSAIILPLCFVYIYLLFKSPPVLNLLNEPSFWFISGILIFFTLTIPFYLMIRYFKHGYLLDVLNIINCLGYILVFSFLLRGYLCKANSLT